MATKADEYRAKAADCVKQAQQASNSTMTEVYQDVARMWLHLAEQEDMRLATENWPDGRPRNTPDREVSNERNVWPPRCIAPIRAQSGR